MTGLNITESYGHMSMFFIFIPNQSCTGGLWANNCQNKPQ